jgi:serine protease
MFRTITILSLLLAYTITFGQQTSNLCVFYTMLSTNEIAKWNIEHPEYTIESISRTLPYYSVSNNSKSRNDLADVLEPIFGQAKIRENHTIEYRETYPDDPQFGDQWSMDRIGATVVWDQTTGGQIFGSNEEIVVAVLDNGFSVNHPDLINNLWKNLDEIPNNGIDDDNNGYVDDYIGYNTKTNNDAHQDLSHGSRTAGIIGASGDNSEGIAGINWNIKLMLISATSSDEMVEAYEYIKAQKLEYIQSNGSRGANVVVTSFSGGITGKDESDYPEWAAAYDQLGELGILSVSSCPNIDADYSIELDMPTRCSSDYLIVATNSTEADRISIDAGYSNIYVDIAAPGEEIPSTNNGLNYKTLSGTSASCPHIAGGIALLYSLDCGFYDNAQNKANLALNLKDIILSSAMPFPDFQGKIVSGGRLDLEAAMLKVRELCGLGSEELSLRTNTIVSNTGITRIEYTSIVSAAMQISLYDVVGNIIATTSNATDVFSTNIVDGAVFGQLPQGIYIISFDNGTEYLTKKLVVQ